MAEICDSCQINTITYKRSSKCSPCRIRVQLIADLKNKYNLSETEYYSIMANQQYRCAICRKHQTEFNQAFSVDHSHLTGQIRGLLCTMCNITVGYFEKRDFAPIRAYLGVR